MPNDTAALPPPASEPLPQRAWHPLERGEARPGRDPRGEDGGGGGGGGGAGGGGGGDAPSRTPADGPGMTAHDAFTFGGATMDSGEADTRFAGGPNAEDVPALEAEYGAAAGTLDDATLDTPVGSPDSIGSGPFNALSGTAELL